MLELDQIIESNNMETVAETKVTKASVSRLKKIKATPKAGRVPNMGKPKNDLPAVFEDIQDVDPAKIAKSFEFQRSQIVLAMKRLRTKYPILLKHQHQAPVRLCCWQNSPGGMSLVHVGLVEFPTF